MHALSTFRCGPFAEHERVGDVLAHGHVREERVLLEHDANTTLCGREARDIAPGEFDSAAGGGLEAGDHLQDGGLSGATRPEQGQELSLPHREVHAIDGGYGAEALAQIPELQR